MGFKWVLIMKYRLQKFAVTQSLLVIIKILMWHIRQCNSTTYWVYIIIRSIFVIVKSKKLNSFHEFDLKNSIYLPITFNIIRLSLRRTLQRFVLWWTLWKTMLVDAPINKSWTGILIMRTGINKGGIFCTITNRKYKCATQRRW